MDKNDVHPHLPPRSGNRQRDRTGSQPAGSIMTSMMLVKPVGNPEDRSEFDSRSPPPRVALPDLLSKSVEVAQHPRLADSSVGEVEERRTRVVDGSTAALLSEQHAVMVARVPQACRGPARRRHEVNHLVVEVRHRRPHLVAVRTPLVSPVHVVTE
jgi:hypothetical protein